LRVDVYVPFLASLLLAIGLRPLTRHLSPATGTRLLVSAGLVTALAWGWTLALLGWATVGQLPAVAARGHWSDTQLHAHEPVATAIAWAASALFLAVTVAAAAMTVRRGRATWAAWRLARQICPAGDGDLVIVPDGPPDAFAVPGLHGRIVVSVGMLKALDADERRVLLAHERAHLRHRHDLWVSTAYLVAAANPLLARLPATITLLVERWADEDAATTVADRGLTVQAICRAGMATSQGRRPPRKLAHTLSAASTHMRQRIDALSRTPVASSRPLVVAVLAVLLLTTIAAVDAGRDTEKAFEAAMHTHQRPAASAHQPARLR